MIFISYSRKDKRFVEPLVKLLRASGQNVFFDKDNIEYGIKWELALENAINNSKRFLLFWSQSTQKSDIVKKEISLALANNKIVMVPIILDNCPLPNGVSEYNGSNDLVELFNEITVKKQKNKKSFRFLILSVVLLFFLLYLFPLRPGTVATDQSESSLEFILFAGILFISVIILAVRILRRRHQITRNYRRASDQLVK